MSGRRTFTTIAEPVTRGPNKPPALGSDPTAGGPLDAFPGPGPAAVRRNRGAPASPSPPAAACSHRPQGPRALPARPAAPRGRGGPGAAAGAGPTTRTA